MLKTHACSGDCSMIAMLLLPPLQQQQRIALEQGSQTELVQMRMHSPDVGAVPHVSQSKFQAPLEGLQRAA